MFGRYRFPDFAIASNGVALEADRYAEHAAVGREKGEVHELRVEGKDTLFRINREALRIV